MKRNALRFLWLAGVVFGFWVLITLITEERDNPPELARLSNLNVEYYTIDDGWVNSASIPTTARRLRICGMMEKSKMATLQVTISEPDDKNIFIRQDEYFFDIQPGEFCIYLYLMYNAAPGNYALWALDARSTVAKLDITFVDD
jgi:hypothetical protein